MQGMQPEPGAHEGRIITLDNSWKREARSLLFEAYRECPVYRHLFSADIPGFAERLRSGLREMCRVYFDSPSSILGLLVNERLVGVAVICGPNSKTLPSIFSWRWKMILTAGFGCTERISDYQKRVATHLDNTYQIPLIGIQPGQQHHGYGRQLIDAVHELVEANNNTRGCLLDTANIEFLEFYLDLGYQVIDTLSIDDFEEKVLFRANPVRLID